MSSDPIPPSSSTEEIVYSCIDCSGPATEENSDQCTECSEFVCDGCWTIDEDEFAYCANCNPANQEEEEEEEDE